MRVRLPYKFSRSEKTIIDEEINKLILQRDMDYAADMDAMILYVLAKEYGWRRKRLKRFWNKFRKAHQELRDYYEMQSNKDNVWLAHRKLADIGVDVKVWEEEMRDTVYVEEKNERT